MKSLVIGMGIGELYKTVLNELKHEVVTVDLVKPADYYDLDSALADHKFFDCVFICTPNFTHFKIANQVAARSKIVFVEKPGVKDANEWNTLIYSHKKTNFMMVKNNQYRKNIETFKNLAVNASVIDIRWINYDRVPNPGTWFTDRSKAFGGVSRDLMPHLLSFITLLRPEFMDNYFIVEKTFKQRWQLLDVSQTDYGNVDPSGIYDVDDYAKLTFKSGNTTVQLIADWRSQSVNDQCIQFLSNPDNKYIHFELGLCPEDAYKNMIETAISNIGNKDFWQDQLKQDLYIHEIVK
jgi:oxidoreductase